MLTRFRNTLAGALLLGAAAAPASADMISAGYGPAGPGGLRGGLLIAARSLEKAPALRIESAAAPSLRAAKPSAGPAAVRADARGPALRTLARPGPQAGLSSATEGPRFTLVRKGGPETWTAFEVDGPRLQLLPGTHPGIRSVFEEAGAGIHAAAKALPPALQVPGVPHGDRDGLLPPAHAGFGLGFDVDRHYFQRNPRGNGPDLGTPPVPEPATAALFALGLLGAAAYGRRLSAKR